MKKKIIILCLLLISFNCISFAQKDKDIRGINEVNKQSSENDKKKSIIEPKKNQSSLRDLINEHITGDEIKTKGIVPPNDYVLYRDVVRRYTWLEGVGEPITQDTADQLPCYFRLSMKNEAGHYQMVEALQGNKLTTKHQLGTYILDSLPTVGKWLFYSDLSGKNVVEERAYEAKANDTQLVYAMQVFQNDSTHVTLTYRDALGLLIDVNKDNSYNDGSVVYVTYDRNGCDSIIDYLDGAGYRKSNINGIDRKRCIYDDKYRLMQITYNNCVGDSVNSVQYAYNDIVNIDVDEKDEQSKVNSPKVGNDTLYCSEIKKQNGWFVPKKGTILRKESSSTPCFRFTNKNQAGNWRQMERLDGNGNYVKWAINHRERLGDAYDNYKNANPEWIEKLETACIYEFIADHSGTVIVQERAYDENMNLIYTYSPPIGNKQDCGFYRDCYGFPVEEIHRNNTSYLNNKKNDVDGICKTKTVFDSIKWTKTNRCYDKNDVLMKTYILQYDKGFNRLLSQDDANTFGVKTRGGGASKMRYYTCGVVNSHNGKIVSLFGRDEFGEPDYITSDDAIYYYKKVLPKENEKIYDEYNKEVENVDNLRDKLPKVMTVEIVDSFAYSRGLRDNDVILLYGDYSVNIDSIYTYFNFRRDWALQTILDAREKKRMVVFRVEDASKNQYGLVEINNLEGTPSELGFLAHIRYLTQKQRKRIDETITANIESDKPIVKEADFLRLKTKGEHYVPVAYIEMYRSNRNKPYAKQITDPAILLGVCIRDNNKYWNVKDDTTETLQPVFDSREKQLPVYPRMDYYLTTDMKTVQHFPLDEKDADITWLETRISDKDYNLLLELYKNNVEAKLR